MPADPERTHEDRTHEDRRHEERGGDSADLDASEEQKAIEEEGGSAGVTHEAIRREGTKELERAVSALAWSGLAAGLSMGLSLLASGALHEGLPDSAWRHLVVSLGYPVGFLVVILGSQQLFTENTLTPIVPLMAKPSLPMLGKVLRLWGVVFVANLVGTLLFAWAITFTNLMGAELRTAVTSIASEAMRPDVPTTFVRAIGAGWLIALLVWMLPESKEQRVLVIIVMTWLVSALKLAHVIVGSAESFFLAATGMQGYGDALLGYILPSLVGNTLGGVLLVAAVNHAQVASSPR